MSLEFKMHRHDKYNKISGFGPGLYDCPSKILGSICNH